MPPLREIVVDAVTVNIVQHFGDDDAVELRIEVVHHIAEIAESMETATVLTTTFAIRIRPAMEKPSECRSMLLPWTASRKPSRSRAR